MSGPRRIRAADLDLREFIRPGDRIVWGQASGEPQTLSEAVVAQRHAIGPVSVFLCSTFTDTLRPEHADRIAMRGFGPMGTSRTLAEAGVLDIVPVHFGQVWRYIQDGLIGCDVAMVALSPPGPDGRHSFGLANDYMQTAMAKARVVLAEVNDRLPWTYGEGSPDLSRVTAIVETSRPPIGAGAPRIGPVEQAIAGHVSGYIEDGAVLQMGIGGIPEAVLRNLGDRRDLGFHSGMAGDSLVDLVERGVVTNTRKPIDTGMSVTGVLLGSDRLHRFADRNPALRLRPTWHTHGGDLLRLPDLVSINSALEVDLTGQVNGESVGATVLGAVGGQPDLVRAAHRAPGGHALLALSSPTRGRTGSRTVRSLSGPVTTPRSDVDVVVTEHGAADLRGLSLGERSRALIAIADPAHRDGLLAPG